MKKDKKNNTILIVIIASIVAIIAIVAIVIFVITSNKKKTEHIITSLGIDDYFKHVLTNEYEKNVNLLDVSKEDFLYLFKRRIIL
jgi:flagellar basal body-associated protein FliL